MTTSSSLLAKVEVASLLHEIDSATGDCEAEFPRENHCMHRFIFTLGEEWIICCRNETDAMMPMCSEIKLRKCHMVVVNIYLFLWC